MTEEEKKLIKNIESSIECLIFPSYFGEGSFIMNIELDDLKILLNLINKQQKEIEELKKDNNHQWEERCKLTFELEKKETELDLMTEEGLKNLKWERDFYKLRFEELNKHWNNIIHKILGENYYNMGCSWDICDNLAEEDLIYEYNHTNFLKRLIKKRK